MQILGIDIGGTGIKTALVETTTGELIGERTRVATPRPATPEDRDIVILLAAYLGATRLIDNLYLTLD